MHHPPKRLTLALRTVAKMKLRTAGGSACQVAASLATADSSSGPFRGPWAAAPRPRPCPRHRRRRPRRPRPRPPGDVRDWATHVECNRHALYNVKEHECNREPQMQPCNQRSQVVGLGARLMNCAFPFVSFPYASFPCASFPRASFSCATFSLYWPGRTQATSQFT